MKVLFINKFLSKETIYRDHLGIMSLSSAIQPLHEVFIIEPHHDDINKTINKIKPHVIAYSIRTGYQQYYIALNSALKKKFKFISVFGGPHATFFPDMIQNDGVDCVCRGEAEGAFLEFLNIIENKGDSTHIKNFWIKKDGEIYKNPPRPLVQNLDTLAFPDRRLFDNYFEIKIAKAKSFIMGRGCPFNCSYCFNEGMKEIYSGQNYIRRRSVDNVIEEIEQVMKEYNFEIAIFEDDTINLDKIWLREFTERFRKLNIKYVCVGLRPDLVDEEVVELLKKGNCIWAVFGVESGDERIRKEVLNRNITNEHIINCATLLKKYNIKFSTENILAIPTCSLDDDFKTLQLNIQCSPEFCHAQLMQPYPGTKIYEIAINLGLFNKNEFDMLTDFNERSHLLLNDKYRRENLQRLFAISVKFPFLYRIVRILIRLRLRFLYSFVYSIYRVTIGLKWLPCTRSMKEYVSLCRRYFFYK